MKKKPAPTAPEAPAAELETPGALPEVVYSHSMTLSAPGGPGSENESVHVDLVAAESGGPCILADFSQDRLCVADAERIARLILSAVKEARAAAKR